MAKITSHVLNGIDGTHAGGIVVCLKNVDTGKTIAEGQTDEGGRLVLEVSPDMVALNQRCQLLFETGAYWFRRGVEGDHVIPQVALLFDVPDPQGHIHMPMILSPHSYSTWKSS